MFGHLLGNMFMLDASTGSGGATDPVPALDDQGNPIVTPAGDDPLPGATKPDNTPSPTDDKTVPYDRFKQKNDEAKALAEELNAIKATQAAAEAKQLEEDGKWKELYEQAEEDKKALAADALQTKKRSELIKAGYDDGQAERFLRYLDGSTDDEISASIEVLKADVPPKQTQEYVDPSLNNGPDGKPANTDAFEYGKDLLARALGKK